MMKSSVDDPPGSKRRELVTLDPGFLRFTEAGLEGVGLALR
jgi:hypothetical protein